MPPFPGFAKANGGHEPVTQVSTYVAIVGRPGRVCLPEVGSTERRGMCENSAANSRDG